MIEGTTFEWQYGQAKQNYYVRTLFVMGDGKDRKYNQKNLKENKKAIAVGYGCLFRPQTGSFATCAQKELIIIKYLATPQDGDHFFQQQYCEGLHLN